MLFIDFPQVEIRWHEARPNRLMKAETKGGCPLNGQTRKKADPFGPALFASGFERKA